MVHQNEVMKAMLLCAVYFCNCVHSLGLLPECLLGVENVDYFFYNKNYRGGIIVRQNASHIPLNTNVTTVFIVHGFTSEANATQYINLTNALINKYDVNVISVDWKDGACSAGGISLTQILSYPSAVSNTAGVGDDISRIISRLIDDYGVSLGDINLIGHSLGAHVAGFAAKDLQKRHIGTVHHIIALDPAGPGFETKECDERICATDAEFLQVFHTSFALGMHTAIGDIDFYFNGGSDQPGCPLLELITCSHSSAVEYLINIFQNPNCTFFGKKWNRMNLNPPQNSCTEETCSIPGPLAAELPARGTFYVDTKYLPFYCNSHS